MGGWVREWVRGVGWKVRPSRVGVAPHAGDVRDLHRAPRVVARRVSKSPGSRVGIFAPALREHAGTGRFRFLVITDVAVLSRAVTLAVGFALLAPVAVDNVEF